MKIVILTSIVATTVLVSLISVCSTLNNINNKLDKLIELNTPEAIQLVVPEKPLLEEK